MGLLDLDENIKLSPRLIITNFIHEFLKTDKKIISGFYCLCIDLIKDDDILYIRKNWNDDGDFIYVYKAKKYQLPSSYKPIRMKRKPVTFKMIKEYYGFA